MNEEQFLKDIKFWEQNEKGSIRIKNLRFKKFLTQKGFYKIYTGEDKDGYTFVQKKENFIDYIDKVKIKDFVLNYLEDSGEEDVYDYFASKPQFFSKESLSITPTADFIVNQDTKKSALIYYKNTAVKITKDKFELIPYDNLDNFVWKKQVIDRDIDLNNESDGEFKRFIWLISGENIDKYYTLKSVIGFLLHSNKDQVSNRAIIFNDELISDLPNGGSGKGLFHYAIKQIKRVTTIDAKKFDSMDRFSMQKIEPDTQVVLFDDAKKGFNFENLFSLITEDFDIEKKNKNVISLSFESSPKITITTNYTIQGEGGSFNRRVFEIEMSSFFNEDYTPEDEFKHKLFLEWNDKEWAKFDNYMLRCVQYFLKNGLVKSEKINLDLRKLIQATNRDFVDFMDTQKFQGQRFYKAELKDKFTEEYEDYKMQKWFTSRKFNEWVVLYCKLKGFEFTKGHTNTQRFITIKDLYTESLNNIDEIMQKETEEQLPF